MPTESVPVGLELLQEYGLVVLFFLFVLEGAMLLFVAPSESLVPFAIATPLATTTEEYVLVLSISVVGATIGQYALFSVAKRGGRERLLGHRWVRIDRTRLATCEEWFGRWGPIVVLVSNSLPFVRGLFTVPAGFAEMDDRRFVLVFALGTMCFETTLAVITLGVIDRFL